jgi:RNA polymerase sigma-70 factor, ECF subfamily
MEGQDQPHGRAIDEISLPSHVTFSPGSLPMRLMDSAVAVLDVEHSVEALYRADADRLWRAVFAFGGDAEVANDAVAEAYAQVLRRGSAVRDPQAWTWRAAFRIASGILKGRRSAAPTSTQSADYTDRYADPDLLSALRRLPEGQRAAVVLFYYADLPISQIAERLDSNSLAVRANLSRGRRRLRQLLGDDDE